MPKKPSPSDPDYVERRGFASLSRSRQLELASKGGVAAHKKGTAHEWTVEEARIAGQKGGQVSRGGRGKAAIGNAAFQALSDDDDDAGESL